jgi:NitT/TauT family transport system substrate-binding protein
MFRSDSSFLKRKTMLSSVGAALAITSRRPLGAQTMSTIRLGSPLGDDLTPALYAAHAGIFKKYGLDVQLTPIGSGAAGLAAVAGGSIEMTLSSVLPIVAARAKGLPFVVLAPGGISLESVPYAGLLVRADAPIHTGRDLNGKTFASPALRDLNAIATLAWVEKNGGDPETLHGVEIPPVAASAAIEEGRLDAATITTPRYTAALLNGKVRNLGNSYAAIAPRFAIAAFVGTQEFAAKNADAVTRFGHAIAEATRFANTHHAETLDLIATFAKLDPKLLATAPRSVGAEILDVRDFRPVLAAALKYKVIDRPMDPQDLISVYALRRRG